MPRSYILYSCPSYLAAYKAKSCHRDQTSYYQTQQEFLRCLKPSFLMFRPILPTTMHRRQS
jgi:hypothetical protein